MTKAEAISNHRQMWRWIAKRTRKLRRKVKKSEYFEHCNIPYEDRPFDSCYVCSFDEQLGGVCEFCPIDWGNAENRCEIGDSFYNQWFRCAENDWERAADLADKIAELPEKIFTDKEGSN